MPFLLPQIESAIYVSAMALKVRFRSPLQGFFYQLYAGRELLAVTPDTLSRSIIGQLQPHVIPQHLTIVAVTAEEANQDLGSELPPRPYCRVKLNFATVDWPADSRFIDITAGTEPSEEPQDSNLLARVQYTADGPFEAETPPLETGEWHFAITGRDNKPESGNPGATVEISAVVLAYPPDILVNSSGQRFTVEQTIDTSGPEPEYVPGSLTIRWEA